jgi:hypothetical protein
VNPPVLIPMGQIIIDDRLQPRQDGLAADHFASLMETPETWPPIVLADINGALYLIDGFHRHEAARRLGIGELAASIFAPTEGTDLFGIAFQLNAKHGRPLTLRDRKAYAAALIARHPDLADREIGRRCSLHHQTVGALRDEWPSARVPRKPGTLRDDVGLLDPIRFGKKATKEQKAIAGYLTRLADAMDDPYMEHSTLEVWPDDPAEIARACVLAMGQKRTTETLDRLEADARFILHVIKAGKTLLKEAS